MLKINWRRWEPTRFMLHHGPPHTRTHTVLYSYIKGWWEEKKQRDWGNIIVLLTSLLVIKVNHHLNRFERTNTHTHARAHAQIHTHRCCYYVGVWLIESITEYMVPHTHTHTQKMYSFPRRVTSLSQWRRQQWVFKNNFETLSIFCSLHFRYTSNQKDIFYFFSITYIWWL